MRYPFNQIEENLYTKGKELMVKKTYENYVGYYYKAAGKHFIGAKLKPGATIELIKYDEKKQKSFNQISQLDSTYIDLYPRILEIIKKDNFEIVKINPTIYLQPTTRYFIKRKNEIDAPVLEVNEVTYVNAYASNFYYYGKIYWDDNIINDTKELEKQVPGVSEYLRNISIIEFSG